MLSLFRDRAVLSPHLCCVCICASGSIRHLFSCTATRMEEASNMEVAATTAEQQEHIVSTGSTSNGVKGRPTKKAKRQFDVSR